MCPLGRYTRRALREELKDDNFMRRNVSIIKVALWFVSAILIVSSCNKDEKPVYNYFVSKELKLSYTTATITSLIDIATQTYPELADIKPYIRYDINVYTMIYNTTINGEEVEVSGLVCTPAAIGTYPVLSFQNGTNTVNAYAPTEYLVNPSSQMVQFISSMGFVVLMADYPGFGKSVNIPHPYLITEPTVNSLVDMIRAVNEGEGSEFQAIYLENKYYLLGYSQGGWATLALHKALEQEYRSDFNLAGSVCGAGAYNMYNMFLGMVNTTEYPMPSYLGYIINAYSAYHQFTNPVSDILNEPYASRLGTLYTGTLTLGQINNQLTTSIPGLFKQEFLSGFAGAANYSTVRDALSNNSLTAWNSAIPLYFIHSDGDTHVPVNSTLTMYDAMIAAGTSTSTCKKLIIPALDHGDAIVPCMTEGLQFLINLKDQE